MIVKQIQVSANGLRFACLEAGEGPLVLLLHGFPDNAYSWEHAIGCGFNRWMQQIGDIVRQVFRSLESFLGAHLVAAPRR